MRKEQLAYEAPTSETLVVRFESAMLTVSGGDPGAAGDDLGIGNSWGFGDED